MLFRSVDAMVFIEHLVVRQRIFKERTGRHALRLRVLAALRIGNPVVTTQYQKSPFSFFNEKGPVILFRNQIQFA